MKLQVLVSTMNKIDCNKLLSDMKITSDAIIINQVNYEGEERINSWSRSDIKLINTNEIGLSKSRNKAILNATGDICLFSDDDLIYRSSYEKEIIDAFKNNCEYDIICFCVKGIDQHFKDYPKKSRKLNYISSMKVSSVEIAFKRESIVKNEVRFDERFGSGSRKYSMGEENIFLYECLKKGLKIKFEPIYIADLYVGDSTWFNGYNKKYFIDKGAAFTAMSRTMSLLLILQFALRKRKIFKTNFNVKDAVKYMIMGKKEYILGNNK